MIQVGRNGSPTSLLCCNAHTETLNHLYGFSIVKCSNEKTVSRNFNLMDLNKDGLLSDEEQEAAKQRVKEKTVS
jgi:hypothetical protein